MSRELIEKVADKVRRELMLLPNSVTDQMIERGIKAAMSLLSDPANITPEMVQAATFAWNDNTHRYPVDRMPFVIAAAFSERAGR